LKLSAFDFETHLSQPGLAAPPVVCASVANSTGAHTLSKAEGLAYLRKKLADPEAHLVGVNIAYDLVCAIAGDPALLKPVFDALEGGRVHDIAIREALIDIAKGDLVERGEEEMGVRYGMRILAERYLGMDLRTEKKSPDAWRKKYALLEGTPIEQWPWAARVYPMRDVALPLEIFWLQEGGPNLHAEADQVRAAFALELMRVWGLRTNPDTVAALRARVERVDLENTIKFREAGILRADGTENQKALRERVTAAYNGDPPKTKKGKVATDRDTLVESGDPILEAYGSAGKNDKYLSTYLPIVEQGVKVPWNPQFNVLVATTRVSSNAQQFPQKGGVRECFEARPGWVFSSTDYGGLELRTMAQRALWEVGYSVMAEVLNSGRDPHLLAAASFMGISYEEAVARYEAGEPLLKAFRDLGKIWNFGKGGGMGPGTMVYNGREGKKGETTKGPDGTVYVGSRFCILARRAQRCGTRKVMTKVKDKQRRICADCLAVAKDLDAGWLRAFPEMKRLFEKTSRMTEASQHVEAMIPVVNIKRGKCRYSQYLNTPFQGLGAAATKKAMWRVVREMYVVPESPLYGSRPSLNVHDELIAEHPEEVAPEAAERLGEIMRDTLREFVPDLAKAVEAEPALSRTMSKDAKTVRDAKGRLQVWEPAPRVAA
jgi:DNA polymerase-1